MNLWAALVRDVPVIYFRLLEVLITVGCFVKIVVVGWMILFVELPAAVAGQSQSLWKCYLHHPYVACWQGGGMKSDFVVLSMTWPIWCWTAYDVEGLLFAGRFFSNDTFLHPCIMIITTYSRHVTAIQPQLRWVWFTTSTEALAVKTSVLFHYKDFSPGESLNIHGSPKDDSTKGSTSIVSEWQWKSDVGEVEAW